MCDIYIYMYMYMYICDIYIYVCICIYVIYIYICICICIYVWYIYICIYVYIIIFLAISLYLLDFLCQRSWISEARRFRAGEAAAEHLRPTGGDPLQELGRGTGDIWGWESHGWNMGKDGKIWEKMRKYGKTGKFWWIKLEFLWFYEFNFLFSSVKRVKIIPCWCCSLGRTQPHIV